ncbi:hypothetical protein [Parabacteroides sp. PF5-6]|uniref:hypothetical protein n=1 Tax=Parabacteroides sp. PF5-6 TaxID=1742403 RepID=UPI002405CE3D|nr:hypothetical protein [Parabacteroides sp. PF5-6]MDF9831252.1 uncharacterized protein (TIGR02145 family) [Parabacteroides sp. PF5-6]
MPSRPNILLLLIAGLFLTACSNETLLHTDLIPPGSWGEDVAGLVVHLGTVRTRADERVQPLDGENAIRSVACFVRTRDYGKPGDDDYRQGAFRSYLLTDDDITDNGDGSFTTSLRVKSPSFAGKSEVAVIANYRENGLTDALQRVKTWDDLYTLVSAETTADGVQPPLLMLGYKEVTLIQGLAVTETIHLQRLVARIDIVNAAANAPGKPFLLTSVELINPKKYTFIVEGNENSYDIPVRPTGNKEWHSDDNIHIHGLYTYEAANDGSVPHTALLIKGTLGGEPYTKRIEMMQDGQIIPLTRNTCYRFRLAPADEGLEVEWSLAVSEWSEGTTIPVQPVFKRPEYKDIAFTDDEGQPSARSFWNEETQTAYLDDLDEGYRITFVVNNIQSTEPEVILLDGSWDELGLETPEARKAFVQKLETYLEEGQLRELYEVTFPQKPLENFEIEIRIENGAKPELFTSFRLLFAPDYTCAIEDLHFVDGYGNDISANTWFPDRLTCLIDHVQPHDAIWFAVRSIQGTTYYLGITEDGLDDLGVHSVDDLIYKYHTEVDGIYTLDYYGIVFPQAPAADVHAELHLLNAANLDYGTSLTLTTNHTIYPGTNTRAVRIDNLYWAPVNVGQTLLETDSPSTASTGNYFQWGRNKAFTQNPEPASSWGPFSLAYATTGAYKDKFIYNTMAPFDWLTSNSTDQNIRNPFWSNAANTPCPTGWRLPTQAEFIRLRDSRDGSVQGEHKKSRRYIIGDDYQPLYFPYMGNIRPNDGKINSAPLFRDIALWAADGSGKQQGYALHINSDLSITVTADYPASGYGLRCVREVLME